MLQTSPSLEAAGTSEVRNVDVVLREAFEKLQSLAPRRLKELRDECATKLDKLQKSAAGGVIADEYFGVLRLACKAEGNPKVVSLSLDTIQKLIVHGFLVGKGAETSQDPATGTTGLSIDSIMECMCSCAEQADDGVQCSLIEALMTAVTSQVCELHGSSLMLAVRKCLDIHRMSKNSNNQKLAQQSLSQMLYVITQRMELSSADMSRRNVANEDSSDGHVRQTGKAMAPSDLASLPPDQLLNDWMSSYLTRLVDDVVRQQKGNTAPEDGIPPPGAFGWCVVCRSPAAHYCRDTKDPVCGHPCKFRNLERIALVETHFGAQKGEEEHLGEVCADVEPDGEGVPNSEALPDGTNQSASPQMPSISVMDASLESTPDQNCNSLNPYHRDALMVFSSLCKITMKDLPSGQLDSRVVRSKKLSLELVLNMLQNCGPVFRSSEEFISVLKNDLCISLIKNSVSSIPKIFGLSLQIFVMLITNFKEHLRTEIGVFIEQIFLRILESGNSTYQHKNRVLHVFYKLCTDASTALELFLNFDCDVDEKNIFERLIDCLSKIAQGKYAAVEHANLIQPHQEQELKMLALQALVTLMGSIVDWARRMSDDQRVSQLDAGQEPRQDQQQEGDSDAEDDTKSEVTLSMVSAASTQSSAIVEQKQRKLLQQIGVNKFNMKPKKGIEYLKQHGFVTDDPEEIATFFRNSDIGLDKTQIGDFLGEDKAFNKSILYAMIDAENFREEELDVSLRKFLSTFRLPGESQKIDRMMEKFAEKYCSDNPSKFECADCAFILSFGLIMLNTDLHNPGIKPERKMTVDEFVRSYRGINNGGNLPREYLEMLYESVQTNHISLPEDEELRSRMESQAAQGASQKFELFVRETQSIVQKSQEVMQQKVMKKKTSAYVLAQDIEHVRPLFEVVRWPMLATLAVLLEMQEQPGSIDSCIEGFKHCIRIAARFDMDTERDAFVSSLAKFTYLTAVKEMKPKNIKCIEALLAIGLSEGNNLGPSWQYVLTCISQLERLQLIGSRARQDFQFFQGDEDAGQAMQRSGVSTSGNQVIKRRAHGLGVSALVSLGSDDRQVELVNSESVMAQIDAAQIDLLFNKSTSLRSHAIVHFVTQLARVSKEELALHDQPRIFSLQKLVEVADYNMNRIRLVWSRIWRVLSSHFVEVASHPNIRVSMYAIDSLRQLAMKFLEKEELSNYNFQADFLRPFEVVMTSTPGVSPEVKELIVSIISNMVQAFISNIKSGWKTVFHILHAAAQEHSNESITRTAFGVLEKVIEKHHHLFVENFSDGISTLLAFGHCKADLQMSLQALAYLLQAAKDLAERNSQGKPGPPPPPPSSLSNGVVALDDAVTVAGASHPAAHWFPVLRGLSLLIGDPRREVRGAALKGFFDCLREHGSAAFDEDTWRMVFNGVIKPLFDDIFHQLQHGEYRNAENSGDQGSSAPAKVTEGTAASWAASMGPPTCLSALTQLVRLFAAHLDVLSFLLDHVLRLIETCIQHDTEAVARIGVEGFKMLLLQSGKNLRPDAWEKVTVSILHLFDESMPTKLMCGEISNSLPFRKDDVVIQCVVQLLLIEMLQDTVKSHYDNIPPRGIMTLLDALQKSFAFAQEFNQQIELRQTLKRLGFMREMRQLPGLLKQEREALSCSLKILFQVQGDVRMQQSECTAKAMDRLMQLCGNVLRNYVSKERLLQQHIQEQTENPSDNPSENPHDKEAAVVEMEREVMGLVPIISDVVMKGLMDLHAGQFARHAHDLFPLLCDLTAVNSREIRLMVRDVLIAQVTPLISKEGGFH